MKSRKDQVGENTIDPDRSPLRKRSRLDPTIAEQVISTDNRSKSRTWDILTSEMADIGVSQLADSDPEEPVEKDNLPNFLDLSTSSTNAAKEERDNNIALMLQSTISKETINKISNGIWDDFLVQKPKRELIFKIDHFQYLSDEVMLQILRWLPKRNLSDVALVCRRWHRLAQDETLWTRLDVSQRSLDSGALGHIVSKQVIILRLSNSEISDPIILPNVRAAHEDFRARLLYLDLSMAHISTDGLVALFSKCDRLKKLSLENVALNDDVLKELSSNKHLEVLNLVMCEGIKTKGLVHLFNGCNKLKELNLGWTYLARDAVEYACSHFPSTLDRLNLSGCRKFITDDYIKHLVSKCPNLRELDLSDCTGLTGDAIEYITDLQHLNFLALSRCYFIPYQSILQLTKISSLIYLDIHGGYMAVAELQRIQSNLGTDVQLNQFKFSSIARPTVGARRTSIWGCKVRD